MKAAAKVTAMMPGLQEVVLKSGPTRFGKLTVLDGRQVYTLTKTLKGLTLPPQELSPIQKQWQAFQTQIAASGN